MPRQLRNLTTSLCGSYTWLWNILGYMLLPQARTSASATSSSARRPVACRPVSRTALFRAATLVILSRLMKMNTAGLFAWPRLSSHGPQIS